VKNGRRETRSRIHMVVDMRGAPPPGLARNMDQITNLLNGGPAALPSAQPSTSASALPSALSTAPQPDGNVVYYRIN